MLMGGCCRCWCRCIASTSAGSSPVSLLLGVVLLLVAYLGGWGGRRGEKDTMAADNSTISRLWKEVSVLEIITRRHHQHGDSCCASLASFWNRAKLRYRLTAVVSFSLISDYPHKLLSIHIVLWQSLACVKKINKIRVPYKCRYDRRWKMSSKCLKVERNSPWRRHEYTHNR